MPDRWSLLPRRLRAPGESPELPASPVKNSRWLELDRVRTTLSFIILAVLLGLIMIGGRRMTWMRAPEAVGMRQGVLIESRLIAPSPSGR